MFVKYISIFSVHCFGGVMHQYSVLIVAAMFWAEILFDPF